MQWRQKNIEFWIVILNEFRKKLPYYYVFDKRGRNRTKIIDRLCIIIPFVCFEILGV